MPRKNKHQNLKSSQNHIIPSIQATSDALDFVSPQLQVIPQIQQPQQLSSQFNQQESNLEDPSEVISVALKNLTLSQIIMQMKESNTKYPNLICLSIDNNFTQQSQQQQSQVQSQNSTQYSYNSINAEQSQTSLFIFRNLPAMPLLIRLELTNTTFAVDALQDIYLIFPILMSLRIVNSNIESLEQLDPLINLIHLRQLELYENPICRNIIPYERYVQLVFNKLKGLEYFDNLDKQLKYVGKEDNEVKTYQKEEVKRNQEENDSDNQHSQEDNLDDIFEEYNRAALITMKQRQGRKKDNEDFQSYLWLQSVMNSKQ